MFDHYFFCVGEIMAHFGFLSRFLKKISGAEAESAVIESCDLIVIKIGCYIAGSGEEFFVFY